MKERLLFLCIVKHSNVLKNREWNDPIWPPLEIVEKCGD
ncbi:hypothetical protein J2S08_003363 [Bacillus chungangensis]|uniref:Uncharacterized protein n=1 Tax=Bacillus chungangensis TaxID=587633 RepID=A0ABT9WWJ4_9BACI|nr:hypothetical protein [Bacillus chungangensis]